MTAPVYLDWNASAPLRSVAKDAMIEALDVTGNPSSVHGHGRAAKTIVEKARDQVAAAVGCKPGEVVFTSGATEAASVLSHLPAGSAVMVEETAHDALWAHHNLTGAGKAPNGPGHVLALGLANSETGVISDVPVRGETGFVFGALSAQSLLLDVTQAIGRIPFAFSWSGADLAVLSAHKIGGPKGVGALILRQGVDIEPLLRGGGQEMGRRSGTENLPGIAGFGAAAEAAAAELAAGAWKKTAEMRELLESTLASYSKMTIFVGNRMNRLPNTSCFATPGWKGETQVMSMDLAGYSISAGSACSSGKVRASRVLQAMGHGPEIAQSAVRVSLGPTTTKDEVLGFANAWGKAWERHCQRAA